MAAKLDINKIIEYWRKGAEYDLETAWALFEKNRYPYALFIGHLALEKLLKAIVAKDTGEHAPRIHNLPMLAGMLSEPVEEKHLEKLAEFMEFHFEGRYPDEQYEFYQKCTKEFCKVKLHEIMDLFQWLQKKLEK